MSKYSGCTNYATRAVNMCFRDELRAALQNQTFTSLNEASCYIKDMVEERLAEIMDPMDDSYFELGVMWRTFCDVDFAELAELYSDCLTIADSSQPSWETSSQPA